MINYVSKENSYTALSTDDLTELEANLNSGISHGIKLYLTDTYDTKMYDRSVKKFIDYFGGGSSGSSSGSSIYFGNMQW